MNNTKQHLLDQIRKEYDEEMFQYRIPRTYQCNDCKRVFEDTKPMHGESYWCRAAGCHGIATEKNVCDLDLKCLI